MGPWGRDDDGQCLIATCDYDRARRLRLIRHGALRRYTHYTDLPAGIKEGCLERLGSSQDERGRWGPLSVSVQLLNAPEMNGCEMFLAMEGEWPCDQTCLRKQPVSAQGRWSGWTVQFARSVLRRGWRFSDRKEMGVLREGIRSTCVLCSCRRTVHVGEATTPPASESRSAFLKACVYVCTAMRAKARGTF